MDYQQVTEDTTIDDLGEWSKIERSNKIWVSTATATTYGTGRSYGKQFSYNKSDDNEKKEEPIRRVFDKITKKYVVKGGDTELQADESAAISVDTDETKVEKDAAAGSTTTAMTITNKKSDTGDNEDKDTAEQKDSDSSVDIDDKTTYTENKGTDDDIIDIDPKDIKVTEVNMKQYPKEIMEAATNAYTALPNSKKGYGNMEDLISAIDIQDEKKAEQLGIVMVANRAFKVNWKDGFMAGYETAPKESEGPSSANDEKSKRRESHIAGLKSMVLLLTKFYDASKGGGRKEYTNLVENRLSGVVSGSNISVNMDKIAEIFNTREQEMIKEVKEVIKKAKEVKS